MNSFSLKQTIIDAAITTKENFWKLLIVYSIPLVLVFILITTLAMIGIGMNPETINTENGPLIAMLFLGGCIAAIFLLVPLILSFYKIALCAIRKETWKIKDIFYGYTHYLRSIHLFIKNIIAVFPWISALFVLIGALIVYLYPFLQPIIMVPIIALIIEMAYKSIQYSQMWFLSIDNPLATPDQALQKSKSMMQGNMWKFVFIILFPVLLSLPFDIINEIFNWNTYARDSHLNSIEYWRSMDIPHSIFSIVYFIITTIISIYSFILVSTFYNMLRNIQHTKNELNLNNTIQQD